MKTSITSLFLFLVGAFSFAQSTHHFYVKDMSTQGYDPFSSITVNVGDVIIFSNGAGGTYNFQVVDQNNQPNFVEWGVPNGQQIYTVTVDASYPAYSTIRVEENVFSPNILKEIEIIKNTANIHEEATVTIKTYPNPAENVIYIETDKQVERVSILTMDGQIVSTTASSDEISVRDLNSGAYIITVLFVDGHLSRKHFIKK